MLDDGLASRQDLNMRRSPDRDVGFERQWLSADDADLIDRMDDLRLRLAELESEDGWAPKIRWRNLYASLMGDEMASSAARAFLEGKIVDLEEAMEGATERRAYRELESKREARGVEVDYWEGFSKLDAQLRGCDVWLYHGTSSVFLPGILETGLLTEPPQASHDNTTRGYVYLADYEQALRYARSSAARFGGEPVVLRVLVPWDELEPDEDDADIPSGRRQFQVPRTVSPYEIYQVDDDWVR